MKDGFRQSMAWLHTWSGLLVGWILFLVFAAGTAAYFRDEINFWMRPELHAITAARDVSQTQVAERTVGFLQQRAAASPRWFIDMPSAREPAVRALWSGPPVPTPAAGERPRRARFENATLDPVTGAVLETPRATRGGDFFYRLHFDLHYMPVLWARWIVGFCAMFMLVAILSGIVTHKRIFKDFFTFRPRKGQRSWLDAHNATAVLALPYHLMITYTGLVTLMFMYMPWAQQAVYRGDERAFNAEVFPSSGPRNPKPAGQPALLAPIGTMVDAARAHWKGAPVGRIVVNNANDMAATVTLTRQDVQHLSVNQPSMVFNGVTGVVVSTTGDDIRPAAETRGVLYGLHLGRFSNPMLRWLFFISGLAGCAMVATGMLLWAVKEKQKHAKTTAKRGRVGYGVRLVDGLNLGTIAGVPLGIATYFWSNRLLPAGLPDRTQTEVNAFFIAWGLAMLAGLCWPARRMWQVQMTLVAVLFVAMPLVHAATQGAHLGISLAAGLWKVAAFDLTCMALGVMFGAIAWWVGRSKSQSRNASALQRTLVAAPVSTQNSAP